ncbi:MAG: hypothetical protein ACI35W_00835 [Anaeroplasmataceae bacterium]
MNNKIDDEKKEESSSNQNTDDIDKKLDEILNNGEMELTPEEIQDLLQGLSKNYKENIFKKIIKKIGSYLYKLILLIIIYASCFGIFHKFIKYNEWYSVLFYILGLSLFNIITGEILSCFKRLKFNPIKYLIFKTIIVLAAMISFNIVDQNIFVFNQMLGLIFYYIVSTILAMFVNYYVIKFMVLRSG